MLARGNAIYGWLTLLPFEQNAVAALAKTGQRCARGVRQPPCCFDHRLQRRPGFPRQHFDNKGLLRSGPRLINIARAIARRTLLAYSAIFRLGRDRVFRVLVLAFFCPDCFPTLLRDGKAGPPPFFTFTPHRHVRFRANLAHQLASYEACTNFRCCNFVQFFRDYRQSVVSRRCLRENNKLRISEFCHVQLLVLATASAATGTTPRWPDRQRGFRSGSP